mmetsp:Transcript_77595/g.219397  ORF Transcript_77595/g.219397 Transcript_77595/m.219397 type:complete len:232 (-) Transcript_77595:84-779(-)
MDLPGRIVPSVSYLCVGVAVAALPVILAGEAATCADRSVQKSLIISSDRLLLFSKSFRVSTSCRSSWCRCFAPEPWSSKTALWSLWSRSSLSQRARQFAASALILFWVAWSVCLRSKTSTSMAASSFSSLVVMAALKSSAPDASRDACSLSATLTSRVASPWLSLSSCAPFFSSCTCALSSSTSRARSCCSWTRAAWRSWIWSRRPFRRVNADSKGLLPFWAMAAGRRGKK